MAKKKKRPTAGNVATLAEPLALEESTENGLRASLEELKEYDGVVGYILRNTTSASIDLKDPTKLIDYAILSSSSLEAGEVLSEELKIGNVKSLVVKGKDVKVLSTVVDENKISVFMENSVDPEEILKKIK